MIEISITNNLCHLDGNRKHLNKLYKDFKVRNPNAFFLRKYMPRGWDGKIDYIRESGTFQTGLLPKVFGAASKLDSVKLIDNRNNKFKKLIIPSKLNSLTPRPYQNRIVNSLIHYKVGDVFFRRGIIKAATNAGKTIIAAMIYKTFQKKTAMIINSTELYNQALQELPELLNADEIGWIGPGKKGVKWAPFMVCKVMSTCNKLSTIQHKLEGYEVVIVDECDLADNKSYKKVLKHFYNAYTKVGMSGSVFVSKLAKDKPKNENIRQLFGEVVDEITNADLQELGFSSKLKIKIHPGNTDVRVPGDFKEEYRLGIVKNKVRNKRILKRLVFNLKKGRLTALVVVKEHKHLRILLKMIQKKLGKKYSIDWVHHARKDRKEVVERFRLGKIDILVGSRIIQRGKNWPYLSYISNAGGGDAPEMILQIMGRGMRKGPSETKYMDDFFDEGYYLKRHSKHRIAYYKNDKQDVKSLVKNVK